MDDGKLLLQIIMRSIATNDDNLAQQLSRLPLGSLPGESFNSLLHRFLQICHDNDNREGVAVIMSAFEDNYTDKYRLPLLSQILTSLLYEDDLAAFILSQYPEKSYQEIISSYIRYDNDPDLVTGLRRLDSIKGPLEYEEYQHLIELAQLNGNVIVEEYLVSVLEKIAPFAPIPPWVKQEEVVSPVILEPNFDIPESDDRIIELITAGVRAQGRSEEERQELIDTLRIKLAGASLEEKRAMITSILENKAIADLASDDKLIGLYGPANFIAGIDLTDKEVMCNRYGGCRMLTCIDFEDFEEYPIEDYEATDWFIGACQQCHLRIRHPWHALRLPLDHGGWVGCYCSEKCLRQNINTEIEEGIENENLLQGLIIDSLMKTLAQQPIYEREMFDSTSQLNIA